MVTAINRLISRQISIKKINYLLKPKSITRDSYYDTRSTPTQLTRHGCILILASTVGFATNEMLLTIDEHLVLRGLHHILYRAILLFV